MREQVRQSNAELFGLINGIHVAVPKPSQNAALPEPMIIDDPSSMPAPDAGYRGLSVEALFASSAPTGLTPFQEHRRQSSTLMPRRCKAVAPPLSIGLLEINKSGSAIGREQLMLFRRQNRLSEAAPRPVLKRTQTVSFGWSTQQSYGLQ